ALPPGSATRPLAEPDALHSLASWLSPRARRNSPAVSKPKQVHFSAEPYRGRNAIERMFGRLKNFRRIANRYDRLANNYLAAVCLAATISYWL
ncbi:transposase, partial [Methylobacterium fujisawaense]